MDGICDTAGWEVGVAHEIDLICWCSDLSGDRVVGCGSCGVP
jgi:hypothetical protein